MNKIFTLRRRGLILVLILLIFSIFVGKVRGLQTTITYNETWDSMQDVNIVCTADNITGLVTTNNTFSGDIGNWAFGWSHTTPSCTLLGRVNDERWGIYGKQFVSWNPSATTFFTARNKLSDSIIIDENSIINVFGNNSQGSAGVFHIFFKDGEGDCTNHFYVDSSADTDTIRTGHCGSTFTNSCQMSFNGVFQTALGTTPPQLYESINCTIVDSNRTSEYVYVIGSSNVASTTSTNLDNIFISALNGTNDLPTFNITFDEDIKCVVNDTDEVQFNVTWKVYDPENNTLYYGSETVLNAITTRVIDYNERIFEIRTPFPTTGRDIQIDTANFEVLERERIYSDSCQIDDSNIFDSDISHLNFNFDETLQDNIVMLYLKSDLTCGEGNNSFYYELKNIFKDFSYQTDMYRIEPTDELNFTFLNKRLETKFKFKIFRNATSMYIQNINSSGLEDINEVFNEGVVRIEINADSENDYYNVRLRNITNRGSDSVNYNLSYFDDNYEDIFIDLVKISVNNETAQSFFSYRGLVETPTLSTTIINNFTTVGIGRKQQVFYISDEKNQPNDFNIQRKTYNVIRCNLYPTDEDLPPRMSSFFYSSGTVYNFMCGNMDSILNTLTGVGGVGRSFEIDACAWGRYAYVLFGLLFSFALATAFIFISGDVGVAVFFITFSLFGTMGVLFNLGFSSGTKYIFLFSFAVGMMALIRGVFFNFSGGSAE